MKTHCFAALLVLAAAPAVLTAAETKAAEKSAPVRHALRGVIVAIDAEQGTFSVKHEEIPGVMRAMTMPFRVDAATLKAFKVGDAITGLMSRRAPYWILEDVKPAPAKSAK